jgi:hypothetical protein
MPNIQPAAAPGLIPPMNVLTPARTNNAPSAQSAPSAVGVQMQAIKARAATVDDVGMLRAENQRLQAQAQTLSQKLKDLHYDKPRCADSRTSVNKDGVTRECSPTACDFENGTCIAFARSTDDCVPPFNWDGGSQCVVLPNPPNTDGSM